MILPPQLMVRRTSIAREAVRSALLLIGLVLSGVAYGRYHFDYRVVGTRCLPRIAYDNGRQIFLWMSHLPGCQPVRAVAGPGPLARPLPVFREAPYWVVGGLAHEVDLTLRKGHIQLWMDSAQKAFARSKRRPMYGGSGPLRKWRLHPGNLRLQLLHWSVLAGYRLVWKGPSWRVRSVHRGHLGLWHALRAVTLWARSRGRILKIRVYGGNHVIAVEPGP